jgi:predicted MFS family arabinose efflux permease
MSFDMSVGSWIADRVPYTTRGRVVGIVETSWAGSLLLVVPVMGLVTAAVGWRWAYVTASALVLLCVVLVLRLLPSEETVRAPEATARTRPRELPRLALATTATFGLLCASSQCVFVTVGPWLEDVFGVGSVGLAGVSALIGLCELVASGSTARLSDRVGKVRAAQWGAMVMVPAAIALLLGRSTLAIGLAGAVVVVTGFEFALVSTLPLATDMVPGAPAAGLGLVFFAGTVGRAVVSPSATALYSAVGMAGPAIAAAAGAALTATSYRYVRGHRA